MKKTLKIFLSLSIFYVLMVALILPTTIANAATRFTFIDSNDIMWEYSVYGGYAVNVKLASFAKGTLNVPSKIDDFPVASVSGTSNSSFLQVYGKYVTSVNFPSTLEEIGNYALYNQDNIKSVSIPNSVTTIGANAFSDMDLLTSIQLPSSLKSLGNYAFSNNKNLTSVTFPNSLKVIPVRCFYSCTALRDISTLNSVTTIQKQAFYNCSNLRKVVLRNTSSTIIGQQAFYGCDRLGALYIYDKSAKIYNNANTIPTAPLIYCYKGSTADTYASKFGRVVKYFN